MSIILMICLGLSVTKRLKRRRKLIQLSSCEKELLYGWRHCLKRHTCVILENNLNFIVLYHILVANLPDYRSFAHMLTLKPYQWPLSPRFKGKIGNKRR